MAYRVLVVANETLQGAPGSLPEDVRPLYERATEVRFVSPVHTGRLEWLVSDVDRKHVQADERLGGILEEMAGIDDHPASGEVGDEDQVVAIGDALARFDADAIVVIAHVPGQENWPERGVVERARRAVRAAGPSSPGDGRRPGAAAASLPDRTRRGDTGVTAGGPRSSVLAVAALTPR